MTAAGRLRVLRANALYLLLAAAGGLLLLTATSPGPWQLLRSTSALPLGPLAGCLQWLFVALQLVAASSIRSSPGLEATSI